MLTYSGTYVNQQWPWNPKTPHGAWGFHERLILHSSRKPLRVWMEVRDRDLWAIRPREGSFRTPRAAGSGLESG